MDTDEFGRELERRLAIIKDPDYTDPAATDLPARDWLLLTVGSLVLVAAMLAWGYPW